MRYLWSRSSDHKILAISTFLVLFLPDYFKFLVLLILLYQLVEARNLYWWTVPIVATVLILRVYIPHVEFPKNIDLAIITEFIKPFLEDGLKITVLAIFLFLTGINMGTTIRWLRYSSTILVLLTIFMYILPATYHRMVIPVEKRGKWVQVQVWAKENTPQDAMFLTPPYRQGFRVYSERSTVVEEKDGTQQYFDTDYSYEWWARMTDIGRGKKYDDLSPERLTELCRKYGASYLVFPAAKKLPFPYVYQNADYRVYFPVR